MYPNEEQDTLMKLAQIYNTNPVSGNPETQAPKPAPLSKTKGAGDIAKNIAMQQGEKALTDTIMGNPVSNPLSSLMGSTAGGGGMDVATQGLASNIGGGGMDIAAKGIASQAAPGAAGTAGTAAGMSGMMSAVAPWIIPALIGYKMFASDGAHVGPLSANFKIGK